VIFFDFFVVTFYINIQQNMVIHLLHFPPFQTTFFFFEWGRKIFGVLTFRESIFEVSDFEISVFGEMAFQGLGIPEKGFRKIEFCKLTGADT